MPRRTSSLRWERTSASSCSASSTPSAPPSSRRPSASTTTRRARPARATPPDRRHRPPPDAGRDPVDRRPLPREGATGRRPRRRVRDAAPARRHRRRLLRPPTHDQRDRPLGARPRRRVRRAPEPAASSRPHAAVGIAPPARGDGAPRRPRRCHPRDARRATQHRLARLSRERTSTSSPCSCRHRTSPTRTWGRMVKFTTSESAAMSYFGLNDAETRRRTSASWMRVADPSRMTTSSALSTCTLTSRTSSPGRNPAAPIETCRSPSRKTPQTGRAWGRPPPVTVAIQ